MKRNFTRILAAFALLVGLTIPMGVWGQNTMTFNAVDDITESTTGTSYVETETTFNFGGFSWIAKGYRTIANESIIIGKGGANYFRTPIVEGTITSVTVTWSGNANYYLALQTTTGTELEAKSNPSEPTTETYTVSGNYSQLQLVGRRASGTSNAAATITNVVVTYTPGSAPQPSTYTVTYNSNITGVSPIVDTYNEGDNVTLRAANTFTNEGYTFSEWNTQADGEGDSYEAEGTISNIQADITLFAIWTEDTPTPEGETATLNIEAYADANSWENGTKYAIATVSPVTFTANGGGNTGKYYTSGEEWRFYQTESASITISVAEGYTLVSVKPTYNVTNNGVLKNGNSTIASGSTVSVSGTSVTFTVGNSGSATNGQVKFTNIDVVYVSEGGTQTASDLTITNESTNLTFDLYNNTTAQVISYTTSSTGAITITPAESDYFSYVHDAAAKTITVTPTAVTPSAQTVTISQEADDDYYAGTATFTVSVANSDPNLPGTENNPYTVAQARAAIDAGTGTQGVYATGIVSEIVTAYNQQYGNISYNISTDGTTTSDQLQAFRGKSYNGENFTSADDIKVGDIVVVKGNLTKYGSTYEFEAANQLVSLVRPAVSSVTVTPSVINVNAESHQETFTVTYENLEPTFTNTVTITYDENGVETTYSWFTALIDSDKNVNCVIANNEGEARTAYFKVRCDGVYSEMITVNQSAYVTTIGNYVRINSLDELQDGSIVVIASRYNENSNEYKAMPNVASGKPEGVAFESVVSDDIEMLPGEIVDGGEINNYYWIVGVNDNGYTFTNANGQMIGYGTSGTDFSNGNHTDWSVEKATSEETAMVGSYSGFVITNVNTSTRGVAFNGTVFGAYSTTANLNSSSYNFFLDFFVQVPVTEYNLTINGYTDVTEGNNNKGYYLIASPVTFDPNGTDMTSGDFDLYYFDQEGDIEEKEWINWESNPFQLEPGTGYLYAKKATPDAQTYYFTLSGEPYNEFGSIPLTYNSTAQFAGWNLIGNPFGEDATLDMPFYRMNGEGSGLEAVEETNSTVYAMEGVFVNAFDQDYGVLSYANFTRAGNTSGEGGMKINLTRNRGTVIDNAIVRFDNGRQLPKFQLFENSTKLYIPQGNKDYAIVRSAAQGEMPVSFRASENGTYTIAVEAENVDMNYLHLIDNMTGADVDLLATPNYTFEARTNDYTSRFRLVFSANGIDEQTAETFAFFNGTSWTVSNTGDATLQVVDITGRIVSSETINGNATVSLNQPAGIYMLRLVNGNDVKVQKVVVR